MPFLANIECCLKFLEYPLLVLSIKMFEFYFQNHFLKYLNKFAVETGKKSSSKLAKSKPSNQSKICSKFQRCILAVFYCWLSTDFLHWFSCIFNIFQKFIYPLFWTSKRHLGRVSKTLKINDLISSVVMEV